jgi:hypothetical protein
MAGGSIAKYIQQSQADGSVKAKLFYFTSDLLDDQTHELSSGTTSISFTVGNNADQLRYSNVAINYTVKVSNEAGDTVYEKTDGSLTASEKSIDTITVGSEASPLTAGTYTVTVQGYTGDADNSGYKKTLKAVFKIQSEPSTVNYELDISNSEYVLLTVWSQNYSGAVDITYPAGLIPDNTDSVMRSVTTDTNFTDSTTFSNSKYSSHVYRFFYSSANTSVNLQGFTVSTATK